MSLKLEVGKKYVNTHGGVVRIICDDRVDGSYRFVGLLTEEGSDKEELSSYAETGDGRWAHNLVAEYDEASKWKTLPVDAKILVSTFGPRYFHSFDSKTGLVYFYPDGKTSWSARAYNLNTYSKVENCTIVKD